jgi:hypothetical protein
MRMWVFSFFLISIFPHSAISMEYFVSNLFQETQIPGNEQLARDFFQKELCA